MSSLVRHIFSVVLVLVVAAIAVRYVDFSVMIIDGGAEADLHVGR